MLTKIRELFVHRFMEYTQDQDLTKEELLFLIVRLVTGRPNPTLVVLRRLGMSDEGMSRIYKTLVERGKIPPKPDSDTWGVI